jgi:hypothetical protein
MLCQSQGLLSSRLPSEFPIKMCNFFFYSDKLLPEALKYMSSHMSNYRDLHLERMKCTRFYLFLPMCPSLCCVPFLFIALLYMVDNLDYALR